MSQPKTLALLLALVLPSLALVQEPEPVFVLEWGTPGGAPGPFAGPHGIAFASNGDVFVSERGNDRVQKFDADGNFLLDWGASARATGNGQFDHPHCRGDLLPGELGSLHCDLLVIVKRSRAARDPGSREQVSVVPTASWFLRELRRRRFLAGRAYASCAGTAVQSGSRFVRGYGVTDKAAACELRLACSKEPILR